MMQSDNTLEIVSRWDNASARLLYDQYYRSLVIFSRRLVDDEETAADIVQDVFLAMWKKQQQFVSISQFKVYLYNAVRNHSINYLRGRRIKEVNLDDPDVSQGVFKMLDETEEDFFSEEVYRQIMLAIDQLPVRQREIFLLLMEGKKNKEIAEILQIDTGTVKTHRRRGLASIKEKIGKDAYILLTTILLAP